MLYIRIYAYYRPMNATMTIYDMAKKNCNIGTAKESKITMYIHRLNLLLSTSVVSFGMGKCDCHDWGNLGMVIVKENTHTQMHTNRIKWSKWRIFSIRNLDVQCDIKCLSFCKSLHLHLCFDEITNWLSLILNFFFLHGVQNRRANGLKLHIFYLNQVNTNKKENEMNSNKIFRMILTLNTSMNMNIDHV